MQARDPGEISMRDVHQADYFTVFEGTFSRQVPVQRKPPVAPLQKTTKSKVATILVVLLLGVSTAAVALTVNQRAHTAKSNWAPSATFVTMPGIASFEDALY
jgi:hypothetical protein